MTERRRGLGRGLGALIPSGSTGTAAPVDVFFAQRPVTPVPHGGPDERPGEGVEGGPGSAAPVLPEPQEESAAAYFSDVPVDAITANPRQPRQVFDPDDLAELVHSLREVGMLQPLVVRPVGEGRFELVMGERRLRAAREAGWASVPAIVRRTADADLLRDALLENLHRSQLNPLEEAAAYGQLLDDFGCTHDELAARIGRSRPQISNTLRLLRLPVAVQKRVAAGVLSAGHARALAGIEDPAVQERLAGRVVAEGLSVRAVEEIVAVGEDGTAAPRARRARQATPVAPRLAEVAERLSDRYDTRVKVDLGARRGRIVVEFASVADLERIVEVMLTGD